MNTEKLRNAIDESGITMTALASKCGMSRETLYNKLESGNFYASEIVAITQALRLTKDERDFIFFS